MPGLLELLQQISGGMQQPQGLLAQGGQPPQGMLPQGFQSNPLMNLSLGLLKANQPSPYKKGFAGLLGDAVLNANDFARQGTNDQLVLAKGQADIAKDNAMTKLYGEGGQGGTTMKAAQAIMQQNPDMSFIDAYSIAKSGLGQGVTMNNGQVTPLPGAPEAAGTIAQGKSRGSALGTEQGGRQGTLNAMTGSLPQLETTVQTLSDLGKKATYTLAGKGRDTLVRQLGMGATEGAKAREEYTNTVRDVLFPQLRQTFGAQFTAKEGDALIQTLGDPDKSPEEKDAALKAFIDQKRQGIGSLQRELGQPNTIGTPATPPAGVVSFQDYFK